MMSDSNCGERISEKYERRPSFVENIRCTVVGDGEVGKTSMLLSYQTDTYPSEYVPTEFDSYSKRTIYNGLPINLVLNDLGGKEQLNTLELHGRIRTDIFLLCFSFKDRLSFENISEKWLGQSQQHYLESIDSLEGLNTRTRPVSDANLLKPTIILVGCQSDVRSNSLLEEIRKFRASTNKDPRNVEASKEVVTSKEALALSKTIEAYKYMECCARNGQGIKEIFNEAIKAVLEKRHYVSSERYI